MEDDVKRQFAEIHAQLTALQLIANEALSVALSYASDPDRAVNLARRDIDEMIEATEKLAIAGPKAEFRKQYIERVRALMKPLLDAIEKRVSQLKLERTVH